MSTLSSKSSRFVTLSSTEKLGYNGHISNSNSLVNADKIKKELLSLCSELPSLSSEKGTDPETNPMQLNSPKFLAQIMPNEKSRKRKNYPKAGPKCRKKNEKEDSIFFDDEKILDSDLLGLAESINADKNLDSDSSTDTIIIDDTIIINDSNTSFNPQSNLSCNVLNAAGERTSPTVSTVFNNTLGPGFTLMQSTESGSQVNVQHLTSIKKETKNNKKKAKPNVSVLREVLTSASSVKSSFLPTEISKQNQLLNLLTETNNNELLGGHPKVTKKKQEKNVMHNAFVDKTSVYNSLNTNSLVPNVCQSSKALNHQSLYASMGLDEDLCDTEQASMKTCNSISKEAKKSNLHTHDSSLGVQIKVEQDDSSYEFKNNKKLTDLKNETLTSDGFHVSMIFEAEPSCEDFDDGEDDMPLSLLKNQNSHDENSTQVKPEPADGFHPSLFIKKELIEDEIISESRAISSENLVPCSLANNTNINLLPLKIKSEPEDARYSTSEFLTKDDSLALDKINSFQNNICNSASLSTDSPRKKIKRNSNAKPVKNKNLSKQNKVPAKLSNDINSLSDVLWMTKKSEHDSDIGVDKINFTPNVSNATLEFNKTPLENVNNIFPLASSASKKTNKKVTKGSKKKTQRKVNIKVVPEKLDVDMSLSNHLISHSELLGKGNNMETDEEVNTVDTSTLFSESDNKTKTQKKKKRKRSTEENTDVDENLPITLLIKRQKSDSIDGNAPDSFLCTNVSRSSSTESRFNCESAKINTSELPIKNSPVPIEKDACSGLMLSGASVTTNKVKKKKKSKKKQSNKIVLDDSATVKEGPTKINAPYSPEIPIEADNIGSNSLHSEDNLSESAQIRDNTTSEFQTHVINHNNSRNILKVFSEEKITENILNSALPIQVKNDLPSISCKVPHHSSTLSLCETPADESMSAVSSQASTLEDMSCRSELSNLEMPTDIDSNLVPKKKKRRARSNGWYKKKKSRAKNKNLALVESNEISDSVPEITDNSIFSIKRPIVVIKNLNSEIKSTENICENTVDVESLEPTAVDMPPKNNKKSKASKKRKIPLKSINFLGDGEESLITQLNGQSSLAEPDKETSSMLTSEKGPSLKQSTLECNKDSASNYTENNGLHSDLSKITEGNVEHSVKETINESGVCSTKRPIEHLLNHDQVMKTPIRNSLAPDLIVDDRQLIPSINVEEMAKDIARLEAIIENQESSNAARFELENSNKQSKNLPLSLIKDINKGPSPPSVNPNGQLSNRELENILQTINTFPSSNIEIKKELGDNICKTSNNQPNHLNSIPSQVNPFRIALTNRESRAHVKAVVQNTSSLTNVEPAKKDELLSMHKGSSANNTERDVNRQLLRVECADIINSSAEPQCNISQRKSQSSQLTNINSIGLSIKKEICSEAKLTSSNSYVIRDQNELIHQVCRPSAETFSISPNSSCMADSQTTSTCSPDVQQNSSILQKKPIECLDDEIQILPLEQTKKDVLVVDLTDDNYQPDTAETRAAEYNTITSLSSEFIEFNKQIKIEKTNSKSSSLIHSDLSEETRQPLVLEKQSSTFSFQKIDIHSQSDQSKIKTNVSDSGFVNDGNYVDEDPKRETNNPYIVRDKYMDEYFKHPFPPSVDFCYKKQRSRSKLYTRINSKAWNLAVTEVASRLKHAEAMSQFGKKLGDIVKLETYPVSLNEVECYHRILGVAPSQKLLSKCYLSPKKLSTMINNDLYTSDLPKTANHCEGKKINQMTCTIEEILQAIETKRMYTNCNAQSESTYSDRDCASADTVCYNSCVSNATDNVTKVASNKDMTNLNTCVTNENELSSLAEGNSNSQNSSLSYVSAFQDTSSKDASQSNKEVSVNQNSDSQVVPGLVNEIADISENNNILTNLSLPSKEMISNILNNESHHSAFSETSNIIPDSFTESRSTTNNNELIQQSENSHIETSLDSELNVKEKSTSLSINKSFNAIDLPIVELRKILETAGSLQSNNSAVSLQSDITAGSLQSDITAGSLECSNIADNLQPCTAESLQSGNSGNLQSSNSGNLQSSNSGNLQSSKAKKLQSSNAGSLKSNAKYDCDGLWKSQATFEYNHTQSIPVFEVNSKQNSKMKGDDSFSATSKNITKQVDKENSDDEYIDNEPIDYGSDNERSDSSSHETEEAAEEPAPLPQYKSKWEKIMERKSQELKEKEKINEHLLKDCFPVSSCIKPKKKPNNSPTKEISQLTKTKLKVSKECKVQSKKSEKESLSKKKDSLSKKKDSSSKEKDSSSKEKDSSSKKQKTSKPKSSKLETNAEHQSKSSKIIKKTEKLKSNTADSKSSKKEIVLKKNNDKKTDEASKLFAPDKFVKTSSIKKPVLPSPPNEDNKGKRFYGNRVTNRGSFLTETSSSELLKMIKIPKKKKIPEVTKKHSNVRSEEFHSMIKSPDINIRSSYFSSHKNANKYVDSRKNSEFYKSPLSDAVPPKSSHFIRTKRMRDREVSYSQSRYSVKNNPQRTPLLGDKPSGLRQPLLGDRPSSHSHQPLLGDKPSQLHHFRDDNMLNEDSFLNSSDSSLNNESVLNRKTHLLEIPSMPSHHFNDENAFSQNIASILPSISSQLPSDSLQSSADPTKALLQKIMSVFQSSPHSFSDDYVLPNPEGVTWNNTEFGSYGVDELSGRPNITSQPNIPMDPVVPMNNPFKNVTHVDPLDPRKAALGSQSSTSTNSIMPVNMQFSDSLDPRRAALGLQPALPMSSSMPISTPLGNIPLSESLNPRRAPPCMPLVSSNKNLVMVHDPSQNTDSHILNSPPYATSLNSVVPQVSRKATCLVPQYLKSWVGHKTIETNNVRLLMLEWSVDWLTQQQKSQDPPPISNALKKVVSSYESFEDYYNTYFPLMLLETWHRIYVSWTHLNQTAPFLCQITSYSVKNHYVSVECQTVFSTESRPKGIFPDDGSILMVKYSTKANDYTIKILGYVTYVKTRRFNPVTDSKICSSLPVHKDTNHDALQILTLTFMGAYNSEDIDKHQPVRIHVLCTVKHNLKQNDAMLFINKSPLQRIILNPVADGILTITLTPRNSPEEKINECVRDITKGILSPHPLPLLTIVRAKPESDRLNIIPLLIQNLKSAYKTKVLLCVRTVRALGDIAANICLQQSLRLVIINKRCDTNPQFQKYLLDELVAAEAKKIEDENSKDKIHLKNETNNKIRKQILKDCDVVLSLIRNSHDDFMSETFIDTDSIAQMCCIVDEANLCTEPETLIPILHGISKLILIGDPDYQAKVLSKTASTYDFNQSFFQRAYDLDLLTD